MDKQHLKRRHNVYWVRVWVPKPVRGILGKSELWKNLNTTDLAEANTKKHRVVAELMDAWRRGGTNSLVFRLHPYLTLNHLVLLVLHHQITD